MLYLPALIVAVVLMACAVVVLVVSEKAEATFPGKNGKIAYQDWFSLVIYTINPNGSSKTKVTEPCVYPSLPDYSPTGQKITYTSCEGTLGKDLGISAINVGGGGKVQVTHLTHNNTDDEEPSYSPDGKKIVYTSWDGHDTEIYTINSDGTGKFQLTNNRTIDQNPSYSPDGKKIVFAGAGRNFPYLPRSYDEEIYTIDVDGKNRDRLTDNATYDYYPAYSPDGRRIAYSRGATVTVRSTRST
jgi:Tol biopolymer transport system component